MNNNNVGGSLPLDASQFQLQNSSIGYDFDVTQQKNSLASSLDLPDYVNYTVKPQDTLWNIADRETGDPLNWTKFRESDGTNFTSDEARRLQINSTVYIPRDTLTGLPLSSVDSFKYNSPSDLTTNYPSSTIPVKDYIPHTIKPNDTLWDIASKELGDPFDWVAILEADGTNFTQKEAKQLQIDSTIYLPKNLTISSQKNQADDVVVTPTPDLQNYLKTIQSGTQEVESSSQKDTVPTLSSNANPNPKEEDSLKPPSNPFASLNLGYTIESENVFEGGNINAGLLRAVVVDDKMEGKISFEPNWELGKEEDKSSDGKLENPFLDPNYAPTLNIEFSNLMREVGKYWETNLIDGLLKWDEKKGFLFQIGESEPFSVWVSELGTNVFDPTTGSPTTSFTVAIEGELNKLISEDIKSQDAFNYLDLADMKGELEYHAKVSWQLTPVPVPIPVYVNEPLPQYTQPRQPVGINPYPIEEPIRQPEIPPQPIEEPKFVPIGISSLEEKPRTQPLQETPKSPIVLDAIDKTNPIEGIIEGLSSPGVGDAILTVATGAAIVGAGALLVSTAPAWLTGSALTAGFIGLTTLGLFKDSENDDFL